MSRPGLLVATGLLGVALGVVLALHAGQTAPDESRKTPDAKAETLTGRVVSLAELLKKSGIELDAEAAPHWLALVADGGAIYPLIKDAGSRPFYRDPRLLNRPMRIQGRLVPGSQLLQVLQIRSLKEGKPHEVFYWCDVCSIKRASLENVCECCGGPMELRETP